MTQGAGSLQLHIMKLGFAGILQVGLQADGSIYRQRQM